MDAHWAVIKSLIEMIEELQKENQRLRSERDAAKRETRTRTANAATTLRRPNTQPPAYTSFAIPSHAGLIGSQPPAQSQTDMDVEPEVIWIIDDED
ncbi:hypothetical protein ACHWQZ_G017426 [Mnemiopsis leidyi]